MSSARLSRMKFRVLAKKSERPKGRHGQKHRPHDFQPELVRDADKRPQRRANRPLRGADRAISSRLLSGNSRQHADFLPVRNFTHGLDFSSLQRYNERTAIGGEPFLQPWHLKNEGDTWIRN